MADGSHPHQKQHRALHPIPNPALPNPATRPHDQEVALTSGDGVKLHAWLLWGRGWTKEQIKERPVVIFFQENAGNMSFRLPFLRLLVYRLNVVVFAMRCARACGAAGGLGTRWLGARSGQHWAGQAFCLLRCKRDT